MEEVLSLLNFEIDKLKKLCDRQFEQRFTTIKYEDKWDDEIFRNYQICVARIGAFAEVMKAL